MASTFLYADGQQRTARGVFIWDGTAWQPARGMWVWDGTAWRMGFDRVLDAPSIFASWEEDGLGLLDAPTIAAVWVHDTLPVLDAPALTALWMPDHPTLDAPTLAVQWVHDVHPVLDAPILSAAWQEAAEQLDAPSIAVSWVHDSIPTLDPPQIAVQWLETQQRLDAPTLAVAWASNALPALNAPSIAVHWQEQRTQLDAPHLAVSWESDTAPPGNLVVNGNAESGTNANFSAFTFTTDAQLPIGTLNCFERTSNSAVLTSDAYIPVDPALAYDLAVWARNVSGDGVRTYFGLAPYDANKFFIAPEHVLAQNATLRSITQAVSATDQVIHLDNVSAINLNSPFAYLAFNALADFSDLPNFTAARIIAVDTTAKTVTLSAQVGKAYAVGTSTRVHNSGGTYLYAAAVNVALGTTWQRFIGTVSGMVDPVLQIGTSNKWRQGTAYVRFLALLNREGTTPTSTARVAGVRLVLDNPTAVLDSPVVTAHWQSSDNPVALDAPMISATWRRDAQPVLDVPQIHATWQSSDVLPKLDSPSITAAWV